ncbi:MAG TPA: TolC family protein [Chitinophagaceae bacterium]|nr:TolC family protein [Chitinophagaceae bacterium]
MRKLIFIFFLPVIAQAQVPLLTAEEALKTGLKNNFNIIVARNDAEADSIFNSPGEAGMLPSIWLNAGAGINRNSIRQKFVNGTEISSPDAGSQNLNASVVLSWTLFDGAKMFVTRQKLSTVQVQGELEFRAAVLNTSAQILSTYYDAVRQKQKLLAVSELIKASEERLKITRSRFESGLGPKTDLNQAKIDLNLERAKQLEQQEMLSTSKRTLNLALGRDIAIIFEVIDSIPEKALSDRAQLEQKMLSANPELQSFHSQLLIAQLGMREYRTQYYPRLSMQAGYGFNFSQSTAGFSLYNQSNGWQTGLTLAIPIYQAGMVRRRVAVSSLEMHSTEMQFKQANLEASLQLQSDLAGYDTRNAMITLEKENVNLARENMNLSLERLRLGQTTSFEVQLAQISLSGALLRLADLQYELKSAEINIHRLAAEL